MLISIHSWELIYAPLIIPSVCNLLKFLSSIQIDIVTVSSRDLFYRRIKGIDKGKFKDDIIRFNSI